MTSILRGGGGRVGVKAKMGCYRTQGGRGLVSVLGIHFFLLKKIGFMA